MNKLSGFLSIAVKGQHDHSNLEKKIVSLENSWFQRLLSRVHEHHGGEHSAHQ